MLLPKFGHHTSGTHIWELLSQYGVERFQLFPSHCLGSGPGHFPISLDVSGRQKSNIYPDRPISLLRRLIVSLLGDKSENVKEAS
jgi:hypothetical protein